MASTIKLELTDDNEADFALVMELHPDVPTISDLILRDYINGSPIKNGAENLRIAAIETKRRELTPADKDAIAAFEKQQRADLAAQIDAKLAGDGITDVVEPSLIQRAWDFLKRPVI